MYYFGIIFIYYSICEKYGCKDFIGNSFTIVGDKLYFTSFEGC